MRAYLPRLNVTPRPCSVPGCHRKHRARGLCMAHYQSARRAEQRAKDTAA